MFRELEKLSAAGLLTITKIGNQKHFQANPASPIFEELKAIVRKTFGLADPLRHALAQYNDVISVAFIYGSIAKGTESPSSDIDIMLISDQVTYPDLLTVFSELETQLGRQINPTIYTGQELKNKLSSSNSFITRVIEQPKIFLIGSDSDIAAIENLVKINQLKIEPGDQGEFDGLLKSGQTSSRIPTIPTCR